MTRGSIKVKAFALLLDPTGTRHVVWRGADETKQPPAFHRLIGGHVEFGESSSDAIVREVREELGVDLLDPQLLGVLENRFIYHRSPGHEVVFLYTGRLSDFGTVPNQGAWFADNGEPIWVEWRSLVDEPVDIPLYPEGATELLEATAPTRQEGG